VLGCSTSGWLGALAADAAENPQRKRSCILLWTSGGPSQLDTFDPGEQCAVMTHSLLGICSQASKLRKGITTANASLRRRIASPGALSVARLEHRLSHETLLGPFSSPDETDG
jgi:hypothetical protein